MTDPDNFRRSVASGLAWESGTKLAIQVLSWFVTIFVARILTPDDYGIVAVSGMFTIFLMMVADFGLASGLVTRPELTDGEIRGTFWFNLYLSTALYLGLYAAAPWIAAAYGMPGLTDLLRVAGIGIFIAALRAVPMAIVLRRLDYRRRALAELAGQGTQAIATLVLALQGFREWSLVWSYLLGQAVTTAFFVLDMKASAWRPTVSLAPVRPILAFGARLTGSKLVGYSIGMADLFVISARLGERAAGYYSLALTLANVPIDKLGALVNRVSFPAVARIQDDPDRVREFFLSSHFWLVMVTAPVAVGGALIAEELVGVLLTDKWAETGRVFALLCVANAFRLSGMLMPSILEGLRHAGLILRYQVLSGLLLVPAFLVGARWGVVGVAAAWAVMSPLLWAALAVWTVRRLGLGLGAFLGSFSSVFWSLLGMAAAVIAVEFLLAGAVSRAALLAIKVAVGAATYATALWVLVPAPRWRQIRAMAREVLPARLHRFVPGLAG